MTPDQALTLGRRAVACKGWRWPTEGGLPRLPRPLVKGVPAIPYYGDTPDLRDPRAVGWLLGLVQEKHGERAHAFVWWCEDYEPGQNGPACQDAGYVCQVQDVEDYGAPLWKSARTAPSVAEALVAALEAA